MSNFATLPRSLLFFLPLPFYLLLPLKSFLWAWKRKEGRKLCWRLAGAVEMRAKKRRAQYLTRRPQSRLGLHICCVAAVRQFSSLYASAQHESASIYLKISLVRSESSSSYCKIRGRLSTVSVALFGPLEQTYLGCSWSININRCDVSHALVFSFLGCHCEYHSAESKLYYKDTFPIC